jgi:hypothetical protein
MDYWVYPWPVEIVNEGSQWAWLAPILSLIGSALLFGGGLYGVFKTNAAATNRQQQALDAARLRHDADLAAQQKHHEEQLAAEQKHHEEQLATMRAENRAERAGQRNDRFREEVANLLGERWATEKAAYELATNAANYYADLNNPAVASERVAELLQFRDEYTPQLNKVEHLAIRASLLTNDVEISAVLDEIRMAAQGWKNLVNQDPIEEFVGIRDRLDNDFARLEELTRRLVTSDGPA